MINNAVEAMFDQALGWPFQVLLRDGGVATASIGVDFLTLSPPWQPTRYRNRHRKTGLGNHGTGDKCSVQRYYPVSGKHDAGICRWRRPTAILARHRLGPDHSQRKTGMSLKEIHPEDWTPAFGYANGMLVPDGTLYIDEQNNWNKDKEFIVKDFIDQME